MPIQSSPFITLCLGSIGIDHVISELFYKGTILQRNYFMQGSHRFEKYLNLDGFLEKCLKIKYALKSTGK